MSETKEINYGPLKELIDVWKGDKGMDITPESNGTEENPYYETLTITEGGDLTNGEEQVLSVLHYRKIVSCKSDNKDWGIVQSPFMKEKALTKNYHQKIVIENGKMTCSETTELEIYGRAFEHTDKNELQLQKQVQKVHGHY